MNPLSNALICRQLKEATDQVMAMESPTEALYLSVIDAQDLALTAIYRSRLPGFLVRRAVPRIQRGADGMPRA